VATARTAAAPTVAMIEAVRMPSLACAVWAGVGVGELGDEQGHDEPERAEQSEAGDVSLGHPGGQAS